MSSMPTAAEVIVAACSYKNPERKRDMQNTVKKTVASDERMNSKTGKRPSFGFCIAVFLP